MVDDLKNAKINSEFSHENTQKTEAVIPPEAVEKERRPEDESGQEEERPKEKKTSVSRPKMKFTPKRTPIVSPRDETTVKIEKIMEEGLMDAYQRLSPVAKQEFKIKGEETALKIRDLLRVSKVKAKKVLGLLMEWLKLLPGVNRFFLEQEAKIKTDKIIALTLRK